MYRSLGESDGPKCTNDPGARGSKTIWVPSKHHHSAGCIHCRARWPLRIAAPGAEAGPCGLLQAGGARFIPSQAQLRGPPPLGRRLADQPRAARAVQPVPAATIRIAALSRSRRGRHRSLSPRRTRQAGVNGARGARRSSGGRSSRSPGLPAAVAPRLVSMTSIQRSVVPRVTSDLTGR